MDWLSKDRRGLSCFCTGYEAARGESRYGIASSCIARQGLVY